MLPTFFVLSKGFTRTKTLFQTGRFLELIATQILVISLIRSSRLPWKHLAPAHCACWSTSIGVLVAAIFLVLGPFSCLGRHRCRSDCRKRPPMNRKSLRRAGQLGLVATVGLVATCVDSQSRPCSDSVRFGIDRRTDAEHHRHRAVQTTSRSRSRRRTRTCSSSTSGTTAPSSSNSTAASSTR